MSVPTPNVNRGVLNPLLNPIKNTTEESIAVWVLGKLPFPNQLNIVNCLTLNIYALFSTATDCRQEAAPETALSRYEAKRQFASNQPILSAKLITSIFTNQNNT